MLNKATLEHRFDPKLFGEDPAAAFFPIIEALPTAVMVCDLSDLKVGYANPASIKLLHSIRHELPIDPDHIVGTVIDVFHRNPAYQRKLLSDPARLPHHARITLGAEILDLAIYELPSVAAGGGRHALLVWYVATDLASKERDTARLLQMIDDMPVAVMTADPDDEFRITYLNRTSTDTLRRIEQHLAIGADQMLGASIDVFHKAPAHQRRLLADPTNLPHKTLIKVGPETLSLLVTAITGDDGRYLGPMLTWSVVTDQVRLMETVRDMTSAVTTASGGMMNRAETMRSEAAQTGTMATDMLADSKRMSQALQTNAAQIHLASDVTQQLAEQATAADAIVVRLLDGTSRVDEVTRLIGDVASQTKMLALNASIEAARAGEAGRGFSVVAGEVKNLAAETTRATYDIAAQVRELQDAAGEVAVAIRDIAARLAGLRDIAMDVATKTEAQARLTERTNDKVEALTDAAIQTGQMAQEVKGLASELAGQSVKLETDLDTLFRRL